MAVEGDEHHLLHPPEDDHKPCAPLRERLICAAVNGLLTRTSVAGGVGQYNWIANVAVEIADEVLRVMQQKRENSAPRDIASSGRAGGG